MPPSGLEFHPPVGTAVWPHIPERGERAYESKTCLIGRSCAPKRTRTAVWALRGPRPGPLDDGGLCTAGLIPAV